MPARATEPLACGGSAVQRRSSWPDTILNVVGNVSGLSKLDRVLPMHATVSSVGGGVWRAHRTVGDAGIGNSGQFSRKYDFAQYADGWPA
jgi:hypothetical protein